MDASLKNLLRVYLRLGEMDPPGVDPYAKIGRESDGARAAVGARSSKELARRRRTNRLCC